jgi:hypothetical protein
MGAPGAGTRNTDGGALRDCAATPNRPYNSVVNSPNPSAIPTAANRAPVHIGAVGMMARDLDRLTVGAPHFQLQVGFST